MKFGIKIDTQVILDTKDSPAVMQAVERGWEVSQEFMQRTVSGSISFTVLVRVLMEGTRFLQYPRDIFPVKLHQED